MPEMETEPDTETPTPETTFTQADLDRIMAKERAKYERKAEALEAKYQSDLKRASMDEAERAKAERDDRIKELERQNADFAKEVALARAEKALAKAGLSESLARMVIGADDDETDANIKELAKAVKSGADAQYNARVSGVPRAPAQSAPSDGGLSVAEKNHMRAMAGLPPIKE